MVRQGNESGETPQKNNSRCTLVPARATQHAARAISPVDLLCKRTAVHPPEQLCGSIRGAMPTRLSRCPLSTHLSELPSTTHLPLLLVSAAGGFRIEKKAMQINPTQGPAYLRRDNA